MKAIRVDDIFAAYKAGQRGAFKFYNTGPPHSAEDGLHFVCPGCGQLGGVRFGRDGWTWDGNRDAPTCTPSILHRSGDGMTECWHGYLTAGEFRP